QQLPAGDGAIAYGQAVDRRRPRAGSRNTTMIMTVLRQQLPAGDGAIAYGQAVDRRRPRAGSRNTTMIMT
ncbi:hypothetical protein CPT12_28400, partial [Klebsiella pneumoniae]